MAGSNCPRFSELQKMAKFKGAYITNSVSIDKGVEALHGGIGLQVLNDIQGGRFNKYSNQLYLFLSPTSLQKIYRFNRYSS